MSEPPTFIDGYTGPRPDSDPTETAEWLDAFDSVVETDGQARAQYLVARLLQEAARNHIAVPGAVSTPYVNTIPPEAETPFPGDAQLEKRIRRFIRWNAAVMVIRANRAAPGIGGHLSTFASSATLYEVGYNHFFRGTADGQPGDHVYFQGHAAPGVYARAFLEGRLDEDDLDRFRREIGAPGLSRRCRLQLTTHVRLSSFSRPAREIEPSVSGSSVSPSPRNDHTREPDVSSMPRFSRYLRNWAW